MEVDIRVDIPKLEAEKALEAALRVFDKQGLNREIYRVEIYRIDSDVIVSFIDKQYRSQRSSRGNLSRIPGFAVTIDGTSLEVRNSQFVR